MLAWVIGFAVYDLDYNFAMYTQSISGLTSLIACLHYIVEYYFVKSVVKESIRLQTPDLCKILPTSPDRKKFLIYFFLFIIYSIVMGFTYQVLENWTFEASFFFSFVTRCC